ncbi:MAG TPA: rhamnulokinase family protein [Dehalococcoidia bacterium]|nr:rhamnulokinase family protein [Dehalococcoidia bacterium]
MPKHLDILAFDLGAESGRAMLGRLDGDRLRLTEVYRFPNGPVAASDGLHWDVRRLFAEIERGLALCCGQYGRPASIGIDAWGVDFALLDEQGRLLFDPFHYRDRRTEGVMEEAFKRVPRREIFEQTGIQFLQINTLYQLLSMALAGSPLLARAATFLTIPDLFNYRLTGRAVCEFTNATTTQFYDPRARAWATALLERLGIPTHFLPEVVMPGTVLGPLLPSVAGETAARGVPVVAPACHDTGSAVAAVPADGDDFAYISSGTWSLVGVEVREPVVSDAGLAANLTNEGGVGGRFRLLRNVAGLWLLQECRRIWAEGDAAPSYDELASLAEQAPPFLSLIDPDDSSFLSPPDMPAAIADFCRKTAQPVPPDRAATVRCVLESLALRYRWVIEQLEAVQTKKVGVIHIVGGGSRNRTLCRFTADATGRRVLAGPVEATAAGNVIVQAMALGRLGSLEEGRALVRRSFETAAYEPDDVAAWDDAYARFLALLGPSETA